MSGPHFREYHLLLDEHAEQLFAMTDPHAERVLAGRSGRNLTTDHEEIVEIEARNTHKLELVTAA